jgi:D-sedoheptulose 7-phosphate isomerase
MEIEMSSLVSADQRERSPLTASSVGSYFELLRCAIGNLPYSAVEQAATELIRAYNQDRTIFLFGNGGSAALASHFACDLAKGTVRIAEGQKRFRVLALTDNVPLITAWANDTCYESIFEEQLRNFVKAGDIAFAISGSGNSSNVLKALEVARGAGACNIGLTGFSGGKMKALCNICIVIPSNNMQVIEDLHLSVAHAIFSVIRCKLGEVELRQALAEACSSNRLAAHFFRQNAKADVI